MTPLLDIGAAATRLAVSTKTIERLIARGELAHVPIGRAVRITPEDLDAYIAWRHAKRFLP